NHRIADLASFSAVCDEPHQLAALYFYRTLDVLVELAYKVSTDFYSRPQLYKHLGQPSIAPVLPALNAQYGHAITFKSNRPRKAVYSPIFGRCNGLNAAGSDRFCRLRAGLIEAVIAFAERATDTTTEALRDGVSVALKPFKDYLLSLHGD